MREGASLWCSHAVVECSPASMTEDLVFARVYRNLEATVLSKVSQMPRAPGASSQVHTESEIIRRSDTDVEGWREEDMGR